MRFVSLALVLTLISCGDADLSKSVKAVDGTDGAPGRDGTSCTIVNNRFVCDDGATSGPITGASPGTSTGGETSGWEIVDNQDGTVTFYRPGKTPITINKQGPAGPQGPKGDRGDPGQNGSSASCTERLMKDGGGCIWIIHCDGSKEKIFDLKTMTVH